MATQTCAICRESLPLDSFARQKQRASGYGSYCKPCAREKYHLPARARKALIPQFFEGEQKCRGCLETLPVASFYWQQDKGRYAYKCKGCRAAQDKARHARNPALRREMNLRTKFDIGIDDFEAILAQQGGGCAICGATEEPGRRGWWSLNVDHCHKTGKVRGVLCGPCNRGIGQLSDDPARLEAAIAYLRKYGEGE